MGREGGEGESEGERGREGGRENGREGRKREGRERERGREGEKEGRREEKEKRGSEGGNRYLKFERSIFPFSSIVHVRRNCIIESVDSISRDEQGFPLTQYITNGGISRARYTITHFKHHHRVLQLISNRM